MSGGAAGVPPGPAAPRTWPRTREGPVGEGEGERGHRDRGGLAFILLGRGRAGKERAEGRQRGGGGPGVPTRVRGPVARSAEAQAT
jgi:hypothetical protein